MKAAGILSAVLNSGLKEAAGAFEDPDESRAPTAAVGDDKDYVDDGPVNVAKGQKTSDKPVSESTTPEAKQNALEVMLNTAEFADMGHLLEVHAPGVYNM